MAAAVTDAAFHTFGNGGPYRDLSNKREPLENLKSDRMRGTVVQFHGYLSLSDCHIQRNQKM